jgi:hypothetical protein
MRTPGFCQIQQLIGVDETDMASSGWGSGRRLLLAVPDHRFEPGRGRGISSSITSSVSRAMRSTMWLTLIAWRCGG